MTKKLIYGVIGTQNTGKTTFIKDVIEYCKTRIVDEQYYNRGVDYRQKITELGLSINRNGTEECQKIIFKTLTDNIIDNMVKNVQSNEYNRILLDRTPIDAFVYTVWHNEYGDKSISQTVIENMWNSLLYSTRILDRIFYIPLSLCDSVEVVDDKFRDTNLEYRNQINEIFEKCISKLIKNKVNISFLYGDREERIKAFLEYEKIDLLSM